MQYFNTMPDTTNGTGFQLLSNTQWQMIVRNAESVGTNWSGGSVGSGVLNRGHSDNAISTNEPTNSWCFGCTSPSVNLSGAPNSIADLNSYFATGNSATGAWHTLGASPTAGTEQKRTHTLSNSVTLWDMAGNIGQWVIESRGALGVTAADGAAGMNDSNWQSYRNGGSNRFSETGNKIFGNFGNSGTPRLQYSESVNAGRIYGGGSYSVVLRGGGSDGMSNVGLFSVYLGYSATTGNRMIGFRCVFVP